MFLGRLDKDGYVMRMALSVKPTLPERPGRSIDPACTHVAAQPHSPAGAHHSARRGYSFRGGPFRWAITSDRLIPWGLEDERGGAAG